MRLALRPRSTSGGPARSRPGHLITLVRVAAAAVMLASSGGLYVLTTSPEFQLGNTGVIVVGARQTRPEAIRDALAVPEGVQPNLFRLRTDQLETAVEALPPVLHASVRVALPDELIVEVQERQPMLVWRIAQRGFFVDAEGVLFAEATPTGQRLPEVVDRRSSTHSRNVGDRLDPVDLAVVRDLGALRPDTVGSRALYFALSVDDESGWRVDAVPGAWQAVFGQYTPQLRTPELIGAQVRCLAALLAGHEAEVKRVYLAPNEERCGTYVPASARP